MRTWQDAMGVTHQEDPDVEQTRLTFRVWTTTCGRSLDEVTRSASPVDCMACVARNVDDARA